MGEVLRARGHEVMLIVSEKEIDAIATEGRSEFRVERAPGIGLQGRSPLAFLRFALKFRAGIAHCRALFAEFPPNAVLGMGGFTSFGPILAGRRRQVPAFVHESNAIPGKANKLNARYCTAVLLGFAECAAHFASARTIVTGTPIRRTLVERIGREKALQSFHLDPARRTLLVMGGSQGAHGLNMAVARAVAALKNEALQVIHLAGKRDEQVLREAYASVQMPAFVAPFWPRMEEAYSAADFAVARSGAASLTELAHFALPSILIPYPHAAEDHQTANARIFEAAGAAEILPESEAVGDVLSQRIQRILAQPGVREEMAARSAALAPKAAAERVADVVMEHCVK